MIIYLAKHTIRAYTYVTTKNTIFFYIIIRLLQSNCALELEYSPRVCRSSSAQCPDSLCQSSFQYTWCPLEEVQSMGLEHAAHSHSVHWGCHDRRREFHSSLGTLYLWCFEWYPQGTEIWHGSLHISYHRVAENWCMLTLFLDHSQ